MYTSFGTLRLARLDMSHNGMSSIADGAFVTLHETLNELDLGYNDFQRFDEVFLDFRMLQYLGLAHNRLGQAFAAGREQLGHLFDSLQLLQVLRLFLHHQRQCWFCRCFVVLVTASTIQ